MQTDLLRPDIHCLADRLRMNSSLQTFMLAGWLLGRTETLAISTAVKNHQATETLKLDVGGSEIEMIGAALTNPRLKSITLGKHRCFDVERRPRHWPVDLLATLPSRIFIYIGVELIWLELQLWLVA